MTNFQQRNIVSYGSRQNYNQKFATKEENCCQKLFSCTMTMLVPHAAAAKFETSNLGFCHIQTSHQATFMPLDRPLYGLRFRSDEEVNEAVHTWTREQPKTCVSDGIRKLADRYKKSNGGRCVCTYVICMYV